MFVYKIVDRGAWEKARAEGRFEGAPVDLADGYVHLSTGAQVRETAAKHFAGQEGLILAAFEAEALGGALRWEPSRGGDLFPHLYRALVPAEAAWEAPLPWEEGGHRFPEGVA